MSKVEYEKIPVAACKHCKSLYIENDDLENDICMRCGAVNEIIIYDNIEKYLEENE
jgi:DNA-directed RNA polymerase subunit RPC12/RpoP